MVEKIDMHAILLENISKNEFEFSKEKNAGHEDSVPSKTIQKRKQISVNNI